MITRFFVFGASGDLTSRYLMPAFARLEQDGYLPPDLEIVGIDRRDWSSDRFRHHIGDTLGTHSPGLSQRSRDALRARLDYRRADVLHPEEVAAAVGPPDAPAVSYLALPPALSAPAITALREAGLPRGSVVVVEKPFGEDLASARDLNELLHASFPERCVFRVDHFLHEQTVQNILGIRFANRLFEPLWSARDIDAVHIVWDETLGLENRASYYDSTGALRDMIQNHLLQLLCLVAMERPAALDEKEVRERKVDLLRAIRRPSAQDAVEDSMRARYRAGVIDRKAIPSYVDEPGVDPERATETFAQVTLRVDNERWKGVPFTLRSGKALARSRREISIRLKPTPRPLFEASTEAPPNVLYFEVEPDRMGLEVNINGAGDPFDLERADMAASFAPQELPAYARLLMKILEGDPILAIRADEAEEAWRVVEPVIDAWEHDRVPLHEYPAGSSGPLVASDYA
jgi:glucose-6-phosphate 1-dehydrogenase